MHEHPFDVEGLRIDGRHVGRLQRRLALTGDRVAVLVGMTGGEDDGAVVEVRLADQGEGVVGLEDRSVLGEEGAQRQGARGDGLDIPRDEWVGNAARVPVGDEWVGVCAASGELLGDG